jgi:ribosomal protein S18 acetylase RimI-like enzyme
MSSVSQLEVLDVRHYSGRQLRPLLEQESIAWEQRLRWDYRSSTELLLQYLDSRILPGFVALEGGKGKGKVCGFTFCVYEGHKAVVGDAYAIAANGNSPVEISRVLLIHLLEVLLHAPNISRVESQLLLFDAGTTTTVFLEHGFSIYTRLFMECDLRPGPAAAELLRSTPQPRSLLGGLQLRQWSNVYYQASAEFIHDCYAGHIDSQINDQYRSLHGSLRFLHNIVRFPGCGVFEESASWLLIDSYSGLIAGIVLCSRVAPRVAHITQLCILPKYRGRGLAKELLSHAMRHLKTNGFEAITLTVTEANGDAVRLYERTGFATSHKFDAMVLDKSPVKLPAAPITA